MKRTVRSSVLSLSRLRMCFLLYVMLVVISTLNSAEINKLNGSKMTYTREKSDSIKNSRKSTISSQQRGKNKVDIQNHIINESATISEDQESSAALNRFLDDVLKAQNDLRWINHASPRVNHITQLDDSLAHTNWHSTVSVNTENVLESTDIGYRSRLRGKRGFDQNYKRIWMLQKKKYGESTHDVPQRVYLDNDMTFKREADDVDFNIFYRPPDMLDRSVYEGEAIADQPLKDRGRKKDLHSSDDWSNSNENPKVTNGENTGLRDYNSAPENLANSDLKGDEKLHVDDDTKNQLEIVSLHDPMDADDFSVLQKSLIMKRKSQNTPLESLKKIVLDLKNSLTINKKKKNALSRESSWWDHPRAVAEIFDLERDLEQHPYKEIIWRIKRAKNVDSEDESDSRISQEVELRKYLGKENLGELHDRAKRSRRSFSADLNNQKDVPENKSHREAQIIKDSLGNVTGIQKIKGVRLYSGYLNNDGRSLTRILNKMNISDSQYPLDKGSFLNNRFTNLTITSPVPNKANISELRYLSVTEPNLNNSSVNNTSLFFVKINLQTSNSPEHIAINEVPKINLKKPSQHSLTEKISKNITAEDHTISLDFGKDFATLLNTSVDSIRFSINGGADDSRKLARNRKNDEEELSARKKSRLDTNDGQSKDAREKFPEGNTSRGFDTAANESRRIHAETIAATKREELETSRMREENRELIPGVIKIFESRERPYQEQEIEARLLGRMREDGTFAEQMRTNDVDESTDANAREDSSSSIDFIIDATVKLEAANVFASESGESITPKDRREDLASMIVDNDLRRQQQMVPSLSATNSSTNKSNGNSDTDGIDIRIVGSNGNETMNVKEGTRTITEAREYHEPDSHLRRRLLWIFTVSVDTETEDSLAKSTESVLNSTTENHIENVMNEDRQSKIINSANSRKVSIRVKRDDNAEENSALQNNFNPQMSDANHHARYKRSTYSFENLESNNAAENVEVGKEAAVNHDEKEENNEEYENVERVKEDYNDSEEDVMKDDDRAMESEREGSSRQRIDLVRAKVDMLIKQKLEKKNKVKGGDYRRKRRSMLDMIEYYDYDNNNEEQERDAPIKEQEIRNKNDKLLIKDETSKEIKRADLGKKKNENIEAMIKEKRKKAKYKEPKEQIVVDLGERKNKTLKNEQKDKKPSSASKSSLRDVLNKGRQLSIEENSGKVRQNEDFTNNIYRGESTDAKSKWLDQSFENKMALPKNSEMALDDNYRKQISLNEPLEIISNAPIDTNPDVIENILLDIQPIKILEQNRELEAWKDFYEDFENERPEDHYYYEGNDQRHPNNVEPLYEELKNVYDWPDGELKSGPRLRGDQRLRYESNNKLDTNSSQLQPLNDRFFGSNQNDNEQKRYQLADASWTSLNNIATDNYITLKVTDMLKGDLEQSGSTKENSPNIFSVTTSIESSVFKIVQDEEGNNLSPERNALRRSKINVDSGSPYENQKYIESETRKVLKRNLNPEKQAAISSQDLHESFVESLDWHDDFDDNVKVRLGRGLKAIDEALISDSNETHDPDNKSDIANTTNINSKLYNSSHIFRHNSSISHDWYYNKTEDLINIFNDHHDVTEWSGEKNQRPILMNTIYIMDGDKDLEAAEQKYVNNQTRVRRTAASYRTFYDDVSENQGDSDDVDKSVRDRFQLSNILEDQSDGVYDEYAATNLNNDVQFDRYSQIPRTDSRKKKISGKKNKKNKQPSEKHAKKNSSSSSSSRNRRHHTHRSDMSRDTNRDDLKPKKESKIEGSSLIGRTRIQKSKTAEQDLLRAGVNEETPSEKVLYENAEDQSTVKPEEGNARRKEITLLLTADNVDDESQMDIALHGELAGKIVEQIFEQIQNNDQLKNVFGPGLQRSYKTKDMVSASNIYRQGFDEDKTNYTETMMKRVKELLGRLILNEVQRKTCVSLSPDMREFLGWMLEVDREEKPLEEVPSLPLIREEIIPEQDSRRKFLFDNTSEAEDIGDLQRKVKVLDTLVKEYNALTAKEKTKVQTVHDYLIRQLNLLLEHIEEREKKEKIAPVSIGAARTGTGNILQYQSAMPNVTNASYSMTKNAFSLPIDTRNFFRFNNIAPQVAGRQHHDGHHRETRSLEVPSKQHRKTKRQKFRNYKKSENNREAKRKHRKHRKHQSRAGSSPGYIKSRQKRASHERRNSLYLGYEEPTIYDSFDLLDAKLTGKKKKRKRELADKKNMTTENDRMLDLLPIKGKNRLEDEVILLNKREAWKKQNEKQLEEVAFGKDMRNGTKREKKRFEKLMEGDKHKLVEETSFRTKREDIIRETSTVKSTDYFDKSHSVSVASSDESGKILKIDYDNNDNGKAKDEDRLRLAEHKINVFADNKTDATIDTATTEVSTREKLVINAGANNQVKGKLCAINRETKIDRANESTTFVNLTSDTNIGVSKERQKVSAPEKETDDNAVKLNRATNYRSEEIDPEIELKNLRQEREKEIYGVADWKMIDFSYDDNDDNLSRNKLREKYVTKLNVPGDLDPENNLELPRLRNNKWSNDVIEWKLLPVIKNSHYDDRALSHLRLTEEEIPISNNIRDVEINPNVYLNNGKFQRLKHRRRRNGVFNISPVLRIIDDDDSLARRIRSKMKRASGIAELKDLRVDPKISLKARKLPRPRNNKRLNDVAEFEMPFILKNYRKLREISSYDPELDDRLIYNKVDLPYRYYDYSPTFHYVPNILRSDAYRYPAGAYLEYRPFKEQSRDSNRRVASRKRFRLKTSGEEVVDFPADNLASKTSKSSPVREKFLVQTDEPALTSRKDDFAFSKTKFARETRRANETESGE